MDTGRSARVRGNYSKQRTYRSSRGQTARPTRLPASASHASHARERFSRGRAVQAARAALIPVSSRVDVVDNGSKRLTPRLFGPLCHEPSDLFRADHQWGDHFVLAATPAKGSPARGYKS